MCERARAREGERARAREIEGGEGVGTRRSVNMNMDGYSCMEGGLGKRGMQTKGRRPGRGWIQAGGRKKYRLERGKA